MVENSCSCSKDNHREENNSVLRSANLKVTEKRMRLLNCLRHSEKPLTAEEVYTYLKEGIEINLSTVYRSLNALTDSEIVTKQTLSDGTTVFKMKDSSHKHIIKCKLCGKISYVNICPVCDFIDAISKETGYEITDHNLEFAGICPDCMENIIVK